MTSRYVVAVDLGGTKIAAAVVDSEGRLLAQRKEPVAKEGFSATVEQVVAIAGDVVRQSGPSWDGIAAAGLVVPGIYNENNGSAWAPNLWGFDDVPLRDALAGRLPVSFVLDCDRSGYVLGEQWQGVARGLTDVVFLAIGTGIGAGILSGGRLLRGADGIAGAVGWFALSPERSGLHQKLGCWEAEAAGPALARRGNAESAEAVVAAARAGDPAARDAVARTVDWLAMGIANLVSLLNPQMIVLGGGLMQAGDLFLEPLRREVPLWAQPVAARCLRIELSQTGERAALLGAARLALG